MTELNLSERSSLNVSQFIMLSQTIVKAVKLYCSFILGKTGFPPKCTVHMWYPDSWNQFLELTYIKMTVNINIKILYSINVITYRSYNRKIIKMPSVKTISLILFFSDWEERNILFMFYGIESVITLMLLLPQSTVIIFFRRWN